MISWHRVAELRDEIGAEDFAEVVALFLEEADDVVARLPNCADAKAVENALHFLKGSALNLGFSELAQQCQDGERLAASGHANIETAGVAQCYAASKAAFEEGLDHLSGHCAA